MFLVLKARNSKKAKKVSHVVKFVLEFPRSKRWWKCIVDQDYLGKWYQIKLKWTLLDFLGIAVNPHTPSVIKKFTLKKILFFFDINIQTSF